MTLSTAPPREPDRAATDAAELAGTVDAWLAEAWDPDVTVREWWRRVAAARWTAPTLPWDCGGRGMTPELEAVVRARFARCGAADPPGGAGRTLAAPILARHGTDDQRHRFLPRILDGTEAWCQLFSEPGAGSDLAGLATRATPNGTAWVITGQKVWTSLAQYADWGLLLARTDPAKPKHRGITCFALPMLQLGIEIRGIRDMVGHTAFSEVFLDGARVPGDCVVGDVDDGWRVANAILSVERSAFGDQSLFSAAVPGTTAGDLDRRAAAFAGVSDPHEFATVSPTTVDLLQRVARDRRRSSDAVLRQELARLWTTVELQRYGRLIGTAGPDGLEQRPLANVAKLLSNRALRQARHVASCLLGPDLTGGGPDAATAAFFRDLVLYSPAPAIYGGTDEIQRNIIAERFLGLPREPGPNDTPFAALRPNGTEQ
ncbi:MAG TPA: acyl-CoA dehydrogenase family protein [Acidimicrobiia bacterium]|nr:acyl-CoA dehydrogenase family protein [Acidimicrobiia bacterium]